VLVQSNVVVGAANVDDDESDDEIDEYKEKAYRDQFDELSIEYLDGTEYMTPAKLLEGARRVRITWPGNGESDLEANWALPLIRGASGGQDRMDFDQYMAIMENRRASKGWRLLQRELPKIVGAPKYTPPNESSSCFVVLGRGRVRFSCSFFESTSIEMNLGARALQGRLSSAGPWCCRDGVLDAERRNGA
jgi:hypothetical protein